MPGYLTVHTDEIRIAWQQLTPEPVRSAGMYISEQDRHDACRIAVVHVPQCWPSAVYCRNCHARFPCPTAQWAIGVLKTSGWTWTDMLTLITQMETGKPGV